MPTRSRRDELPHAGTGSGMNNAAVIGLGTMGPGIAATLARAGMNVTAFDADPAKRLKAAPAFAAASTVLAALAVPDHTAQVIAVHDSLAVCVAGSHRSCHSGS